MTIAQRLYALILTSVVGLLVIAGLAYVQTEKVYTTTNYTNINTVPSLHELDGARRAVARVRTLGWKGLAVKGVDELAKLDTESKAAQAQAVAALNKYEKEDISDDKDKALLDADRSALNAYMSVQAKAMGLMLAGNEREARDLLMANEPAQVKLSDAFEAHREFNVKLGKDAAERAAATMHSANLIGLIVTMVVVICVATMGLLLTRRLIGSLNAAVDIAQTVASGDLTRRIEVTSRDETGRLMQALKDMNDSLVKIVGEVRQGTDSIFTASSEIAAGNLDLSSRTEQQAGSLEETASSMEELTATVKQNADNARQANVLAASASSVAVQGGAVVAQVVETMASINESSKKVVDIISVIDGIAFQTNILALNAAVEAARAGEQGRGFAVVAGEVRSLAQRSAQAAKEIKTLIDDSVGKTDAGARLVDQAGTTMNEVVASVQRVTDIMGEISSASAEQTQGIGQINEAIVQMDQVTQQNAALVEQAAAAAEAMQDQASRLAQMVGTFKLDGAHAGAASDAAAPHDGKPAGSKAAPLARLSAPAAKPAAKPVARPAPARAAAAAAPKRAAPAKVSAPSEGDWEEF